MTDEILADAAAGSAAHAAAALAEAAEEGNASAEAKVVDAREAAAEAEAPAAAQAKKVAADANAGADGQSAQTAQAHYEAMHERARTVVAAYEHGMETNSPRTMAELNVLKALFFGE